MAYSTSTKIIATIGPATDSECKIKELITAGVNVIRLNSSHSNKETHKNVINLIRKVCQELNTYTAIMLDLQGPKIRIGNLIEPKVLTEGEDVTLMHQTDQTDPNILPVDYSRIIEDVNIDDVILLDDGKITLKISSKTENTITAKVIYGGVLTSRKGLNVPGANFSISALTDSDVEYVKFAVENNIDYIALSFVRNKEDVLLTKNYIKQFNGNTPVISKIEKPQALDNLDAIISVSDGIMVARGDLGIEISPENVPIAQKEIIEKANKQRKPVIVATQMLESMICQPLPTRAEASDIANAIIDGADAVMLSAETAVGKFPIKAVEMIKSIARNVEKSRHYKNNVTLEKVEDIYDIPSQAISSAITNTIDEVGIDAIVVLTRTGSSAILLSKEKPSVPIIAVSDSQEVCNKLSLLWGVFSVQMDYKDRLTQNSIKAIDEVLLEKTFLKENDSIALAGGLPFLGFKRTTFFILHKVGASQEGVDLS